MFALYRIVFPGATKSYLVLSVNLIPDSAKRSNNRSNTSNTTPARLAKSVWCTKFQSSLLNIYFRLSGFQISLLLIYFRDVHTSPKYNTIAVRYVTPNFRVSAAQLHSITEIAPPQSFLFVNRSPILYDFRGGAKVIRYRVLK